MVHQVFSVHLFHFSHVGEENTTNSCSTILFKIRQFVTLGIFIDCGGRSVDSETILAIAPATPPLGQWYDIDLLDCLLEVDQEGIGKICYFSNIAEKNLDIFSRKIQQRG